LSASAPPVVDLARVSKVYPRGGGDVVALDGVSLRIERGEKVAIMGPSGSGKSTLLGILGCLDRPSIGEYRLDGEAVASLDDDRLSHIRNLRIGFVFQSFHLIPELTVAENVETPLLYGPVPLPDWRPRALASLGRVGLGHRADHRPSELSGGEAQRAAIARALVTEPRLILADEPTGNLDSATGEEIAGLLDGLHAEGRTIVLVTHNEALGRRASRRIHLRDGRVEGDSAP
jgi:putative ABC transport system ATP-binding protein